MNDSKKPHRAVDILAATLPSAKLALVPRSFDILGSVAIVEIPRGLGRYEKKIAQAIMQIHKPVKTVLKKQGAMEGKYRIRKMRVIGGKKTTETLYREHNVQMKLDVARVYFSVRLSNERKRISEQVKSGEKVLVFFAGVGPYALVIAKQHPGAHVAGIEMNPTAIRYFRENIGLNRLKNCVSVKGDVRKVIRKRIKLGTENRKPVGWADRIVMPLPHTAKEFLDEAMACARNGAIVHYYRFGDSETPFEDARTDIHAAAKRNKCDVKILNEKIVRPYAPRIVQIVVDFMVTNRVNK